MKLEAAYVTEREAAVIRSLPHIDHYFDFVSMTLRFRDSEGIVVIPRNTVVQYMDDWKQSGMWSLPGTKPDAVGNPSNKSSNK